MIFPRRRKFPSGVNPDIDPPFSNVFPRYLYSREFQPVACILHLNADACFADIPFGKFVIEKTRGSRNSRPFFSLSPPLLSLYLFAIFDSIAGGTIENRVDSIETALIVL